MIQVDKTLDKSYVPVRWFWFILGMVISASSSAIAIGAWMKTVELNDQAQAKDAEESHQRLNSIDESLRIITSRISNIDGKLEIYFNMKK